MKKYAAAGIGLALLIGAVVYAADDAPKMPEPQKEHAWLHQLVGEWETEAEITGAPGQPPEKCRGKERVRKIGGFWIVADVEGKMPGTDKTMNAMLTLGYDPQQKKYIGTWIDSMLSHMWRYTGTLDADKKVLTLDTEGPSFATPGKMAKYRDVFEIKNKDYKTLTSSVLGDDGKWTSFITVHYRRK